jgi:hypothetical protein
MREMIKMKRILLVAIMAAMALAATGCIFDPRSPDSPATEGDPWVVPILPKDIFQNIRTGFIAVANSNYERSLADNFVFIARAQDWPDAPAWGKAEELDFLTRVKGDYTAGRNIQFGDENMIFERENVEVGRAEYEGLYVITLDRGGGEPVETYAGKAIFIVEKGATGWALISWEDVDIYETYSTSTYLRRSLQ